MIWWKKKIAELKAVIEETTQEAYLANTHIKTIVAQARADERAKVLREVFDWLEKKGWYRLLEDYVVIRIPKSEWQALESEVKK